MHHRKVQVTLLLAIFLSFPTMADPSPLEQVQITRGMARADLEKRIAKALAKPNNYSAHGNNLRGGTVKYTDGVVTLEVTYNPGSPAPRVVKEGKNVSLPPLDETVKSYRFFHQK